MGGISLDDDENDIDFTPEYDDDDENEEEEEEDDEYSNFSALYDRDRYSMANRIELAKLNGI